MAECRLALAAMAAVVLVAAAPAAEFRLGRVAEGRTDVPAGTFCAKQGSIMVWTTCDSRDLSFTDAAGKPVLAVFNNPHFPGFRVAMKDGKQLNYTRRAAMGPGDWMYLALVWREGDSACRAYVNGMPYENYFTCGERSHWNIAGNRLDEIRAIVFERKNANHKFNWEGLTVTDRPLTNREVAEEYRKRMPLDFVSVDSIFYANEPAQPYATIAPGGAFTRPNPVEGFTNITATVDAKIELFSAIPPVGNAKPEILASREFKQLKVTAETDLKFDPVTVKPGKYWVRLTVNPTFHIRP